MSNPMKFLHLSDLHLGKSLGEFDLIEDQKYILEQLLEIIDRESIDAVLIAGDVYDKAIPSEAATGLLDRFLSSLAEKKVDTFVISGNHDSDDRLNFGSTLFETNRIFISSIFDGTLKKHTLEKDGTKVNVYLLPFVKASQVRHFYPDKKIETYEDAVRVILENTEIDENEYNVLAAHQFVAGKGEDPAFGGSESIGTQSVGLVEKIGYKCFDRFDYVALGHIHSPQKIGRDEVRYSGSPLKYSLSEANDDKSVPVVIFKGSRGMGNAAGMSGAEAAGGNTGAENARDCAESENSRETQVMVDLIPLRPMRNMRHIRGKMQELLDKKNIQAPDDFIYATLTDEDIVNDAMGIFQQVYPNTVKIDYDNSHTRDIEQVDISKIAQNRSFADLIGDFYKQMYGCEISPDEMDIMRMVAREAGVINEAD